MATLGRLTAKCSGDMLAVCESVVAGGFAAECEVGSAGRLRRPWGSGNAPRPLWHSRAGPFVWEKLKREPIRSCAGWCGGGQPENPAGFWLTGYSGGEARTGTSVRTQLRLVVVSAQRAKADGGVEVPGRTGQSRYPAVTHCDLHSWGPAFPQTPAHSKVSAVRWKVVLVRLASLARAGQSYRVNWRTKEADLRPTHQKGKQKTDSENSLYTGAHGGIAWRRAHVEFEHSSLSTDGTAAPLGSWFIRGPANSLLASTPRPVNVMPIDPIEHDPLLSAVADPPSLSKS
nr:hypothetical protein B1D1.230 [imported] - Neurospora crassa [Neurospora crassa]